MAKAIHQKIILGLVPLLVAAALSVAPAMAQAQTTEYGTEAGGVFTPFPTEARQSATVTGSSFKLENVEKTADIECTSLKGGGFVWNDGSGVGHSHFVLAFEGCEGTGELASPVCATPNGNGIIEGVVTDQVLTETTVEVAIESGFEVNCPESASSLGKVTGKAVGTQSGGTLSFAQAPGLMFLGQASTITGSDTVDVEGQPVVIN